MTDPKSDANDDLGSLDRYADQASASDSVSGEQYENMLDEGWSPPEREINVERFDEVDETIDDRLNEEVPDDVPGSAYGNPEGTQDASNEFDDTRVGRIEEADEEFGGRANDMEGVDEGFAGGASTAEEAAMHYDDGRDQDGFDDGIEE